jgi:hypothetical protein
MADVAVLVATAASIFGPLALVFALAVRDFRRRARAGFSPTAPSSDIGGAPGKVVLRVVGKSRRSWASDAAAPGRDGSLRATLGNPRGRGGGCENWLPPSQTATHRQKMRGVRALSKLAPR